MVKVNVFVMLRHFNQFGSLTSLVVEYVIPYLDFIKQADIIKGYCASCRINKQILNEGAQVRNSVSREQWLAKWQRKS
jgi:hypothetical protein